MPKQNSNLVQSLERGLIALEMAVDGGVKPSDLAKALGVDRSTAYRLLYTLMVKGYLNQNPSTHEFVANPAKLFELNSKVHEQMDWLSIASRFLNMLRDNTGETANLGVLHDREIVYVGQQRAQETVIVNHSLGARRPLHCSALGKAIIAFLSPAEVDRLLPDDQLPARTLKTITDLQTLKLELNKVRQSGYAVDDEETIEGVRCIAAPILDHSGQVIAAIGISGPATRVTARTLPIIAATVVEVARQASTALGAPKNDGRESKVTMQSL